MTCWGNAITSPSTPTTNFNLSPPHEPYQRRLLIDYFDSMMALDWLEEATCYDSNGNGLSSVVQDEFDYMKKSLMMIMQQVILVQFLYHQKKIGKLSH